MRSVLVLILVVGCGERRASTKVAFGGAAASATGVLLLKSMEGDDEAPGNMVLAGGLLMFGGALVAAIWGIDAIVAGDPDEEKPPVAKAPVAHPGRARARALMIDAAAAARRDECEAVRTADVAVRGLDEEFHAVVFVRDVAIARCLAAGEQPAPEGIGR